MATYKSMSALKAALQKTLVPATNTMAKKIEQKVDEKVMEYYQEYSPIYYNRTGTMSNAPQKTDAISTGDGASATVYADTGLSYSAKGWSMVEVWDSANNYLHGGLNVGNGVAVWDEPMEESKMESHRMWLESLRAAGLPVK